MDRMVLSTGDLEHRLRQWVEMESPSAQMTATARHARPAMLGAYVKPYGPIETQVAELWERLLGIEGIGAQDSFFELGGNSLSLTQLLAQIRKCFQLELSLAALFERPTIADIALLIESSRALVQSPRLDGEREEGVVRERGGAVIIHATIHGRAPAEQQALMCSAEKARYLRFS